MALALKSWLEVRVRLLIGVAGWCFMLLMFWLVAHDEHGSRNVSQAIGPICAVVVVMVMVFGAMLAGTGVLTQLCNSASTRMADSVLFTLSLPVSRRRVFATRALQGAGAAALMMLLFWTLLPVLLGRFGVSPPFRLLLAAIPFQLVAAALAYTFALLGTCLFSEMVMAWILGGTGLLGGIGAGLGWQPLTGFLDFASGATYMTTGQISWFGVAVCVALSCLFVFAAVRTIERREF